MGNYEKSVQGGGGYVWEITKSPSKGVADLYGELRKVRPGGWRICMGNYEKSVQGGGGE